MEADENSKKGEAKIHLFKWAYKNHKLSQQSFIMFMMKYYLYLPNKL